MSHRVIRNVLIALELFVALAAIGGGLALLADANGIMGLKDEWLRGSPFTNYQIPALGLIMGVAGSSLLAAFALLRARYEAGELLSIGAGIVLTGFEVFEAWWFGLRNGQQLVLFAVGLLIAVLAAVLRRADVADQRLSALL